MDPIAASDNMDEIRPPRRGLLIRSGIVGLVVAIVTVLSVGQYAAAQGDDDDIEAGRFEPRKVSPSTEPATTDPTTTTLAPTTTTTIPALIQPAAIALPPVPGGSVGQGARAAEIMGYEARLVELHFDPGPVDGVFDAKTRTAVEAFDKLMGWARDGVIDQPFVDTLATFQYPTPHMPAAEADRVEIDLDRQVIILYKGYQVALVTPTSTGNGKRFCGGSDGCQYAVTYAGKYKFDWHVNGWRTGKLGRLYNPWYFNGGIAIHGYTSVPVKPASHGCSRIPMHIAEYFGTLVYDDMTVYVVGIQAPEGGYPPDSPTGGSPGGGGGGGSAPTTPTTPPTAPPATAPPETTPPDTVAPVGPPDTTAPPVTSPPPTDPPPTTPPTEPPPATTTQPPQPPPEP